MELINVQALGLSEYWIVFEKILIALHVIISALTHKRAYDPDLLQARACG